MAPPRAEPALGARPYPGDVIKVLLVVVLFAALVYGLVWTVQRRHQLGGARRPRPQRRIVAPDDDDDFLRSIKPEHDEDDPENPTSRA